jgi:hypothetical protein
VSLDLVEALSASKKIAAGQGQFRIGKEYRGMMAFRPSD